MAFALGLFTALLVSLFFYNFQKRKELTKIKKACKIYCELEEKKLTK